MWRDALPTVTAPPHADAVLELRQAPTEIPELCGFLDRTSASKCGAGSTCKFNTDIYAVGCCQDDNCDWQTTCCGYSPGPATVTWDSFTSTCGGATDTLVGVCNDSHVPFCGTNRYENGFTAYFCTGNTDTLTGSVYFTSAGQTTAWPGLPRLTGKNGPEAAVSSGPQTVTVLVTATPGNTNSAPSPGVIAGSVVGGAAFGAIATLLAVLLTWYFRNKGRRPKGLLVAGSSESSPATGTGPFTSVGTTHSPAAATVSAMSETAESPYSGFKPSPQTQLGRYPYEVDSHDRQELPSRDARWELATK